MDDVAQLHREMIDAGVNYYTGKQAYKEAIQPPPSDGLRFTYPDAEDEEYELLGKTEDSLAHYWRDIDRFLEIRRFEHTLEGDLEQVEDDTDRFSHLRTHYLKRYIDERDWEILREPDYSEIRENTENSSVDVPEDTEQATFGDIQ